MKMSQNNLIKRILTLSMILIASVATLHAQDQFLNGDDSSRYSTIPHNPEMEQAIVDAKMDRIAVRHMGWDETIRSWARIKLDEITSKQSIRGQDPVYTVLSLMYEQDKWFSANIFPIEHPEVGKVLGLNGKWISAEDFLEKGDTDSLQEILNEYQSRKDELDEMVKVLNAVKQAGYYEIDQAGVIASFIPEGFDSAEFHDLVNQPEKKTKLKADYEELRKQVKSENAFRRAGQSLIRRWQIASHLREEFLIIPDLESLDSGWISADESRPSNIGRGEGKPEIVQVSTSVLREQNFTIQNAAYAFDQKLVGAFAQQSPDIIKEATNTFLERVSTLDVYPTDGYRSLLNFYVGFKPMNKAAYIYGLSAILFGLFAFFRHKAFLWSAIGGLLLGFALHTFGGVSRLMLTGHIPVSNMYESITFAAWSAVLIGTSLELWKRKGSFGLGTSIIVFLMMMGVSLMPLHDARLHPLRAVLNSYWLNIHVTAMLVSYGAFMVATFYAIAYLFKALILKKLGRESLFKGREPMMSMEVTEQFMYRLIQIGWPILTVGICLGAVWADTAWGRYWGWDPKETWALITWMIYTIYLHSRMVMSWKGVGSAIFAIAGFIMVMITWLGVSYLPWFAGGLHTYASPN